MKLLKFNSVKFAIFISIIYSLFNVLLINSYSTLITGNTKKLIFNCMVIFILYIINNLLLSLNERAKSVSSYYLRRQLNTRIDNYYGNINYTDFMSKPVGERASIYVNDVAKVVNLTLLRVLSIVYNISLIIFILFSLYKIHFVMFVIGILLGLSLLTIQYFFQEKLTGYILESQNSSESFLKNITENLLGYSTFIENCSFNIFKFRSEKISEVYANSITKIDIFAGNMSAVLTFVSNFFNIVSAGVLAYLVIEQKVEVGMFLAVIRLMPSLGQSLEGLTSEKSFLTSGYELYKAKLGFMEETYDKEFTKPFIKRNNKIKEVSFNSVNSPSIEKIELKNLVVHYKDKDISYKNLCFEKGKKYALVGKSGCGKSTLLKAILGEINDYDGEILINGKEKNKDEYLFNNISYVNQNTFLFNDTLENNINIHNTDLGISEILKSVDLDLDSKMLLTENGKNLSGGQRQRISIARALTRNKSVLFLDEATSSLDKKTMEIIEEMILKKDIMVIMITHKLTEETKSTLDEIIDLSM